MNSPLASLAVLLCALSLPAFALEKSATTPVPRQEEWCQKRHTAFNEVSKQGEAELVFLGDSITQGWEGAGKAAWASHWAPLKAANFGIGGDRTEHVLWRLRNGNYDGLKPKLTVLMIGTNNTGHQKPGGYSSPAEDTAEGVAAILKALREKQPQMKVLLLAIFPRGADKNDKWRQQNEATNALIAKLADNKTVFFTDIGSVFLNADGTLPRDIMPDLLHLNPAGYAKWAEAIEPKVKELLK